MISPHADTFHQPKRSTRLRRRLAVDTLEDRSVPAAIIYVNGSWAGTQLGTDPDGAGPATDYGVDSFSTIQAAVNAVDAGGKVIVEAGTYGEFVTVSKAMTIDGAQAGVDARTGRTGAAESVVDHNANNQAGFYITANNVVVDGFTVQNSTNGAFPGFGFLLGAGTSGSRVLDNIIQNNIAGISLANTGASQAVIHHNLIRNNNQSGPVSGHGIYTDQYNAGGTLANVLIDSNSFVGNAVTGIGFSSTDATKPATGITISNNVFDANGRGLYAFNLTNSSITGNTFQNSTDAATAEIRLFEGVSGLTISHNVLENGAGRALRINNVGTGSPNATSVAFTYNSISGYTGPAGTFQVDTGGYTGPLNATANWWGALSGPTIATNPGGAGATLVDPDGAVNFRPWLVYSPDSNPALPGVQLPTTVTITGGGDVSPAANDFTLLQNAVGAVASGQTLNLSGNFDWTAANAAAAYTASSAGSANGDIRGIKLPGGLTGVTITSLAADAHIHGGGDTADAIYNAFLFADDSAAPGATANLTIEHLNIDHFEAGTVFGWNSTGTFNGTQVRDNTVTLSGDNGGLSDVQNIAFYFWNGTNQQLTGNTVNFEANGTRTAGTGARSFGFQNGTTGGTGYNGLVIANNTFQVLSSATTEVVTGIWENGHNDDNSSHISIVNNKFLGLPGHLFDRGLMLTSQTTGMVIDGNTFTNVDNVFFARNLSGGTDPGDQFTFTNNVLTNVGGTDGIFLQNVTNDPVPVHVVINWNINNTIDGETGVRGLNELSTQATHASRPNSGATDLNSVNAIGPITDTFVKSDWGTAGRFTDPDGIGQGLGPIAFGFNTFNTIQAGVNAASAGSTVGVLAGTYAESVTVNNSLKILGAQNGVNPSAGRTAGGSAESLVQATGGDAFTVSAPNVTIDGFSITTGAGGVYGVRETTPVVGTTVHDNFIFGLTGGLGVAIASGSSSFQVTGNDISNNYAGVYLSNNAFGGTVSGNFIHNHIGTNGADNGSGIVFEGGNPNITVTGNDISGNRHGIYVWTGFGSNLSGTTVADNSLAGNTVAGVINTNSAVLDASGNWWGTNVAANVANAAGAGVDFSPWLDAGTDSDPTTAFAGSFATLDVGTGGTQTGSTGRIQEGVNLVSAGGTVNVTAGTYPENVTISKNLTLAGVGPTTVISPAGGAGVAIATTGGTATVRDLSITGAASAITATGPTSLTLSNLKLTGNTSGGSVTGVPTINFRTDPGPADESVVVTPTQFGLLGQDAISYSGVSTLNVTTGAGNDTINVTPSPTTAINVDGGANGTAGDTLIVNRNGLAATITSTQVLVNGRQPVSFVNVEHVSAPAAVLVGGDLLIGGTNKSDAIGVSMDATGKNVVVKINGATVGKFLLSDITGRIVVHGGDGNDTIRVAANVPVGADLFGEAGNDKLYGGRGNDRLDGGTGNDTEVGGAGDDTLVAGTGQDLLVGSTGSDTVVGPDATVAWRITGSGSGTLKATATTTFRSVENLIGGSGDDTFKFVGRGSIAGRIDGGAGVNTLDYSSIGSGVRVNLFAGTATATGGVADIANVIGGAGNDILVGDAQANRLVGGGGRDILIGGDGADSLVGGNGDDLLIGGKTAFDGSASALNSLMAEWQRPIALATRIQHLTRAKSGGANGATVLTAATVFDDAGAPDSLQGGAGSDWFITFAGDSITDQTAADTVTIL
jgi:parallel beta-helix repeat protein